MMMISENAELHRMQRTFRQVLDAFAQPGTVRVIELSPSNATRPVALCAALESLVRLLVDQAVPFGVADSEADSVATYVTSETHALSVALREAAFVVVPARADAQLAYDAVREAQPGNPASPEMGATLLMGCSRIVQGANPAKTDALYLIEVSGPGVRDTNRFAIDRIDWARARADRGDEFPCGVDMVLVDGAGNLVAIPRSVQVRVVPVETNQLVEEVL